MPYKPSEPKRRWTEERLARLNVLAAGHATIGGVTGPGRPRDASKPLAHAYIIGMLGEFQGYARDLHDVAVDRIISASGAAPSFAPILVDGIVGGRGIDRGNATRRTLKSDFARIGLSPFDLGRYNSRWTNGDQGRFDTLIDLRNALGHANETNLRRLIASGRAKDTVSWARAELPVLNRFVKALDRIVWEHLKKTTGKEPWT